MECFLCHMPSVGHRVLSLPLVVEGTPQYCHICPLVYSKFGKHIKYITSLWDLPSREVEYTTRLSPHTLESSNAPSWQAKENSSGQCWQAKWVYKPKQSLD